MEIVVNSIHTVFEGLSLLDLAYQENIFSKKGIAIAINEDIIPKSEWNSTELKPRDRVLIITATAGG